MEELDLCAVIKIKIEDYELVDDERSVDGIVDEIGCVIEKNGCKRK